MKLHSSKHGFVIILLFGFIVVTACTILYLNQRTAREQYKNEGVKMQQLFNQPQWSNIDFSKGITQYSMRPLLKDDKQQLDAVRNASRNAGIEQPVIPYFDSDPPNSKAHYFHAQFKHNLTDSLGYEQRFVAFADYDTLKPLFSIWVSVIPQQINEKNEYINVPEQKELIYSINTYPKTIEKDVKQYFISNGFLEDNP